jgi:hypothetical protein
MRYHDGRHQATDSRKEDAMSTTMQRAAAASARRDGVLASFSRHMVDFAERYFPDAYVFVLLAVLAVAAGAVMRPARSTSWLTLPWTISAPC